jgi:TatD DNase family protein
MYIDIHRHSTDKGYADKVVRNLFSYETEQVELTEQCSVGLHPWHVTQDNLDNEISLVKKASSLKKVIAIGEAGLDKAINNPINVQRKAFENQIDIAKTSNKPMVIHCVRAYDELLAYRKNAYSAKPWIIHWYNASPQTGEDLINKGCYLSFGLMLFNETSKAFKTFKRAPLEYIFFETDDAEININEVYNKAAQIKKIDIELLKKQIIKNFHNCFGIEV